MKFGISSKQTTKTNKKVQEGKDQEKAQSEKDSHNLFEQSLINNTFRFQASI